MSTYKIVARTNGYIANRDILFSGKTEVIIEKNLSLKEAQCKLLDMYNEKYEDERPYAPNWGLAVIQSNPLGATPTLSDGTRSFEYS